MEELQTSIDIVIEDLYSIINPRKDITDFNKLIETAEEDIQYLSDDNNFELFKEKIDFQKLTILFEEILKTGISNEIIKKIKDQVLNSLEEISDNLVLLEHYNFESVKEMKTTFGEMDFVINEYYNLETEYNDSVNRDERKELIREKRKLEKKYKELSEIFSRKIAFIDDLELTTFGDFVENYGYFDTDLRSMKNEITIINDTNELIKLLDEKIEELVNLSKNLQ